MCKTPRSDVTIYTSCSTKSHSARICGDRELNDAEEPLRRRGALYKIESSDACETLALSPKTIRTQEAKIKPSLKWRLNAVSRFFSFDSAASTALKKA